jgi:hypothetical protein
MALVVAILGGRVPDTAAAESGGPPVSAVEIAVDDTPFHSDAFIQAHVAKDEWVRFPVRAGMAYRVSLWWTEDAGVLTYLCDGNAAEVLGYPGWVRDQPSTRWMCANADGFYYVHEWNPGGSPLGGRYTLSVLQRPFDEVASTIAGAVRDAPEGTVAAGASIGIRPADSWVAGPVATATAGADGTWSASVLPGSYTVRFDDPLGVRTGEYFDHLTQVGGYPDAPTAVRVPESTSVAAIDGTLALRGKVVGRIVSSAGSGGIGGVTVTSRSSVGDGSAVTAPDGRFEIDGIDTGWPHELLVTEAAGWRVTGGETLPYGVAPGATFAPTVVMYPVGSIAGRVTNSAGDPLPGIRVARLTSGSLVALASTVTDTGGRYGFDGLGVGAGSLSFSDPSGTYATLVRDTLVVWADETVLDAAMSAGGAPTSTVTTFAITPSAGAHGSISPAMAQTVAAGDSTTFTITPEAGYHVVAVLVDGAPVGAVRSYTFLNVAASHTISASFAKTLQVLRLSIASDRGVSTRGHAVRFSGGTSPSVPNGTRLSFQVRRTGSATWTTLSVRSTFSGHRWSYTLSTTHRRRGTYYCRVRYSGSAYLPAVSALKKLAIR